MVNWKLNFWWSGQPTVIPKSRGSRLLGYGSQRWLKEGCVGSQDLEGENTFKLLENIIYSTDKLVSEFGKSKRVRDSYNPSF